MFLHSVTCHASRYPGIIQQFFLSLISFFIFFLQASQTFSQDKVYDEIYSVLGDSDREVIPEDIFRFKYLEMVLKESLRLFPPGAIFSRKINENVKLSKSH